MPRPATARRALRPVRFAAVGCTLLLVSLGIFGLHKLQVRRNADSLLNRGREAAADGDYVAATQLFKRYRNFRPNDPEGLRAYAEALDKANPDRTPGEELAATYLRLDSLDALEPAERERLARLYLRLGNPGRARENAERLLRDSPGDAGLTEIVAASREIDGDFPAAIADYRRAVETGQATPAAYIRLAELLRTRVKTSEADAEAAKVLARLVSDAPNDSQRLVARAKARARAGDQAGAYADAVAAVKTPGEPNADAALTLAALATETAQLPLARDALEKSIAVDPGSVRLRLALADIAARAGDPASARATLRNAAESYQKRDITLLSIGDRLIDFGDLDAASTVAARFAADPDTAAPADYLTGRVALAKSDWPTAVTSLEKSVALEGFARFPALRSRALTALAEACVGSGDANRRRSALAEARRLDPTNLVADVAWASLIARENPDEAVALLAAAPNDPQARAALVELKTTLQLAKPENQRDWASVDRAAGTAPRAAQVDVAYASALLAQGKTADAKRLLEAAVKRPGTLGQAGVRIALALAQSATDLPAARKTLTDLERQSGDSAELRLARLALLARDPKPDAKAAAKLADNLEKLPPVDRSRVAGNVAQVVLAAGDQATALALLRRAAAAEPTNWSPRLAALDLATAIGDESTKAQMLAELSRFDAPIPAVAEATALLRELRPGDTRIATLQEKLAFAQPGFGPAEVVSGELARLAGQDDLAIAHYRHAVDAGERSDGVLRNFTTLLIRNGSRREATDLLARIGRARGLPADLAKQLTILLATSGTIGTAGVTWADANPDADWRDQLGRAAVYQSANKPAEAKRAAQKAVTLAGDRPEPWQTLVLLLAADGPRRDVLDAVAAAEKKLPIEGEPRVAATNALARGWLNRIVGRATEAEAAYRAAKKALPDDPNVTAQLAAFLRDSGRPAEAVAEWKSLADSSRPEVARMARRNLALELVAGQPTPARRVEALALLDKNLGEGNLIDDRRAKALVIATDPLRLAEGIAALRATATDSPLSAEQNYYLGQMEAQAGNLPAAEAALQEAVRGDDPATDHLAMLAKVQLRRGNASAASATAARLKQLAPAGWQTTATELRLLAHAGKPDEAAATLSESPFAKQTMLIAPLLEELGLNSAAENVYRAAVTDAPTGHARLAAYRIRNGQGDATATLAFEHAKSAPPALTARLLAGAVQANSTPDTVTKVQAWLMPRLAENPDDPNLVLLNAVLLDRNGQHAQALAAYERGLQSSPNDEAFLNNAAMLAAVVDQDGGPRPLGWLATLFAARGATPATLDTRAVVHLAGGRAEDAIRDLTAAIGLQPSPVYYFHLAQAHDLKPEDTSEVKERNSAIDEAVRLGLQAWQLHPLERPTFERYKSVRGR